MQVEERRAMEKYAIYSLFPEDAKFSKRYVSSKICVSSKASYKIYNYDKTILSSLDTIHDKYRSVVFSHPENKLLCFSPPKSIEYFDFVQKYPKMEREQLGRKYNITATEKIEGISIQLFYDPRIHSWEISTKTNIGGNYWYFANTCLNKCNNKNTPTFYDMFLDALIQPRNISLNDVPWISELSKTHCYSFVLQHPENFIVIPIKSPKLWLVAIYEIRNNSAIHFPSYEYKNWPILKNMVGVIDFPKVLIVDSYQELQKHVCKYSNHPFRLAKGIVIWNETTGERTMLHNRNYTDLIKLWEISPWIMYEYLCMKRIGQIAEYVQYVPFHKKTVAILDSIYDDFIKTLHTCYMDVYVFKKECLENVNQQYRPHIEYLHKHFYLPNIRTRKPIKITKSCVKSYFDNMEPREQLYILTYLRRERDNA